MSGGSTGQLEHFLAWSERYWGLLFEDRDARWRSLVYGWDGQGLGSAERAVVAEQGAMWGFVERGQCTIADGSRTPSVVGGGDFFATRNGAELTIEPGARLFAVQQIGFLGISSCGGPIEERGRLRYIDRCSDTLLVAPLVEGDPCLNHLHFPPAIDQTRHTHPSLRAGMIARGRGSCTTPAGVVPLVAGLIFVIPTGGVHAFQTQDRSMDVIAYHPDSDYGPRHEDHPMVNRTLVDGRKIDNTTGRHAEAEIIEGRFAVDGAILTAGRRAR